MKTLKRKKIKVKNSKLRMLMKKGLLELCGLKGCVNKLRGLVPKGCPIE